MKKQLVIGEANGKPLALPLDFVTATSVVYGGKGMGKTNFASVLAEEIDAAGERFSYIDPLGVTWGLRHSSGPGTAGLEILILGGVHGGIPIEPGAGKIVADLVVDEKVSVVIDISRRVNGEMWSKADKIRFVADYTTQLYMRQGEKRRRLLQIYDEAARFIPQMIPHGSPELARCVGAIEQATEEGRNVGLGVCFITQRSARMAKSVSELADCMVAFRTIGPNSMEAVLDWLGDHIPKTKWIEYQSQIRELPIGSALVVSPGWLKHEGVVRIRPRKTFDSSATPKAGARRKRPGAAKKIDLGVYRARMAATIEKAKAEDPKELRAQIDAGKKQLAKLESELAQAKKAKVKEVVKKVPMLTDTQIKRLEKIVQKFTDTVNRHRESAQDILLKGSGLIGDIAAAIKNAQAPVTSVTVTGVKGMSPIIEAAVVKNVSTVTSGDTGVSHNLTVDGDTELSKAQQKIIDILAELHDIGIASPHRGMVAAHCGVPPTSGGYSNNLWQLKNAGLVGYPAKGVVALTNKGIELAATPARLPTLAAYHQHWMNLLSGAQQKLLRLILRAHPTSLSRLALAAEVGVPATSGGYSNDLWRMKSLGCIDYPTKGFVAATPIMNPEGLR